MITQHTTLADLGDWGSGGTPLASRGEYYGGNIPWLIIEDLNDGIVEKASRCITQLGLEESSAKIVPAGTVLIAMYGSIGKLGIAGIQCATNQAIAFCKCDSTKVTAPYLFYFLLHERDRFLSAGRGGTQQNISQDFLKNYPIELPDPREQARVVALMTKADRLLRTRRYAVELSTTILAAAFIDFFGHEAAFSEILTVEELAADKPNAIRTGPFGSQLLHSEFTDHGIAVLGIDNAVKNRFEWAERRYITREKFEKLKRYTVHPGDVLITIMGTCGRCAVIPNNIETAINTKHLCCISVDSLRCLPNFLHGAFLYHPFIQRQLRASTKGAIMEGLNMEIIKRIRVPLPPPLAQQKYVTLALKHQRLLEEQHEALRQAEHLFESLLHRAFSPHP